MCVSCKHRHTSCASVCRSLHSEKKDFKNVINSIQSHMDHIAHPEEQMLHSNVIICEVYFIHACTFNSCYTLS